MRRSRLLIGLSILFLFLCELGVPVTASAAGTKKTSAGTPAARKTASKKPSSGKSATTRKRSTAKKQAASSRSRRSASRRTNRWRPAQTAPTKERFHEIEAALVQTGHLAPEDLDGEWNEQSMDALKHFQEANQLDPNGRLDSLTLIALGLGPKRPRNEAVSPSADGSGANDQ